MEGPAELGFDPKGWRRHAVVSLAVPVGHQSGGRRRSARSVVAPAWEGSTTVRCVNGDTTLVRLSGPVDANSVPASVEAQAVSGDLRVSTISGDLTVVEGTGSRGEGRLHRRRMVLDLDPSALCADVTAEHRLRRDRHRTRSPVDAKVDANTTSGSVSCAFDELRVRGQWGTKRITGRDRQVGRGDLEGLHRLRRHRPAAPAKKKKKKKKNFSPMETGIRVSAPSGRISDMPPVFAHGRLRLYLLKLLDESPPPRLRGDPAAGGAFPGAVRAVRRHRLPAAGQAGEGGTGHPHHRGRPQGLLPHRRRTARNSASRQGRAGRPGTGDPRLGLGVGRRDPRGRPRGGGRPAP